MASIAPSKVIPTSFNYASLSSYLSLPSTTSEVISPSALASTHTRSSLTAPPDVGSLERQRLLRQNQEITRLCSLKSIQIRQSETRLSQLESENIGLRATVNKMQRQIEHRASHQRHRSPTSPSHRKTAQSTTVANYSTPQKEDTARAVGKDPLLMDDHVINAGTGSNEAIIHKGLDTSRIDTGSPAVSKDALLQQLDCIQTIYEASHDCDIIENELQKRRG